MACKFGGCDKDNFWNVWFDGCGHLYCTEHMMKSVIYGVNDSPVTLVTNTSLNISIPVDNANFAPDRLAGLTSMVREAYYQLTDGEFVNPYTDPVFIIDKVREIHERDMDRCSDTGGPKQKHDESNGSPPEQEARKIIGIKVYGVDGDVEEYTGTGWSPHCHDVHHHLDILGKDGEIIGHYAPGTWRCVRVARIPD